MCSHKGDLPSALGTPTSSTLQIADVHVHVHIHLHACHNVRNPFLGQVYNGIQQISVFMLITKDTVHAVRPW